MKTKSRLFLIYFPVLLVGCQIACNLLYFINVSWYNAAGFYLSVMFGTNVLFAVFLFLFTFSFKFCDISRWAATAELLFAANYIIVQEDNLYNILFQVIVGLVAIGLTFSKYVRKFPDCRLARWVEYYRTFGRFFRAAVGEKSCKKGFERWEKENQIKYSKRYNHVTVEP